jgi:hypothetical protein
LSPRATNSAHASDDRVYLSSGELLEAHALFAGNLGRGAVDGCMDQRFDFWLLRRRRGSHRHLRAGSRGFGRHAVGVEQGVVDAPLADLGPPNGLPTRPRPVSCAVAGSRKAQHSSHACGTSLQNPGRLNRRLIPDGVARRFDTTDRIESELRHRPDGAEHGDRQSRCWRPGLAVQLRGRHRRDRRRSRMV